MFRNYLKTALRNLFKNKLFFSVNIFYLYHWYGSLPAHSAVCGLGAEL